MNLLIEVQLWDRYEGITNWRDRTEVIEERTTRKGEKDRGKHT